MNLIKLCILCSLLWRVPSIWAVDRSDLARNVVLSQARLTFSHLGSRLRLDTNIIRQNGDQLWLELMVGTARRPSYMVNCFIVTFENNGIDYIKNIEQLWDQPCLTD